MEPLSKGAEEGGLGMRRGRRGEEVGVEKVEGGGGDENEGGRRRRRRKKEEVEVTSILCSLSRSIFPPPLPPRSPPVTKQPG